MTRAVLALLLFFGPLAPGPVAARSSSFAERLRAAAEPDREVGEDDGEGEAPQDDEGLGEPDIESPPPYGEGEGQGEGGGGRRPSPHGLPGGQQDAPTPPPAGQKPIDPGPAEPARAVAPLGPIE